MQAIAARMNKAVSHAAIVVNLREEDKTTTTREEIIKLGEVITWMILTGASQISLFDKHGCLQKEQEFIQTEVCRRLGKNLCEGEKNGCQEKE